MKIYTILIACLVATGCAGVIDTPTPGETYNMDWFYEHNGYAVATMRTIQNNPVMEIIAVPLNSEAMWPLVHDQIKDAEVFAKLRIKRQRPVFLLSAYAHTDCVFLWRSFALQQGRSKVYPTSAVPPDSPLLAAIGKLYTRYGVRRVRAVNRRLSLFTNPYTGRDKRELDKEIELAPGMNFSAVVTFEGGLDLSQPLRLVCKGERHVLDSGKTYQTRDISKLVKIYTLPGQDAPGTDVYKYGDQKMDGKRKRKRIGPN